MFVFGSGNFYGTNTAANSTPWKFAQVQDVTFDFTNTIKELFGQNNVAIDVRRGEQKITGKCKFATIHGAMLNDLFFGQTATTGLLLTAIAEAGTISTSPSTISVANSATWSEDLGVVDATTGTPYTLVASTPSTGQYSVAAGVYTFATADAGKNVLIDYIYTSATGGTKIAMTNQSMGTTPTFKGVFSQTVDSKNITLILNKMTSSKLAMQTKLEDYTYPEMDLQVMDDGTGNIGTLSISD